MVTPTPAVPSAEAPSAPPSGDDTVALCEARQDHTCVVRLLADHAQSDPDLVSLVRAYRGLGRDADCRREMRHYLNVFPSGTHAEIYRQRLRETTPTVPQLPERTRVAEAFRSVAGLVAPCGVEGTLNASVVFRSDGAVSEVTVLSPFAHTAVDLCASRAIRRMHVPPFSRPTFTVVYPFTLGH